MFCPSCGLQDTQSNQYCRSCGTDLRSVNTVLEEPNKLAASPTSAREEIGRALAAKIQNTSSSSELTEFTKKILPDVEKFLESPEERKMRRIRNGSITAFVGLGATVGFYLASILGPAEDVIIVAAAGFAAFFIGVAMIINGVHFTVPQSASTQASFDDPSDVDSVGIDSTTNDLLMPAPAQQEFSSVTENTTKHLKKNEPTSSSLKTSKTKSPQ